MRRFVIAGTIFLVMLFPGVAAHASERVSGLRDGVWAGAYVDFTNVYLGSIGVDTLPGVAFGWRKGLYSFGGELDTTFVRDSRDNGPNSYVIRKKFNFALGPSAEKVIRFHDSVDYYARGALRFRYYWEGREETVGSVTRDEALYKVYGFELLALVGARYCPSRSFSFGVEAGLAVLYLKEKTTEQYPVHQLTSFGPISRVVFTAVW